MMGIEIACLILSKISFVVIRRVVLEVVTLKGHTENSSSQITGLILTRLRPVDEITTILSPSSAPQQMYLGPHT